MSLELPAQINFKQGVSLETSFRPSSSLVREERLPIARLSLTLILEDSNFRWMKIQWNPDFSNF